MKPLRRNSFRKIFNKISIGLFVIAGSLLTDKSLPQTLPTWEVNNPVSKVFVLDKIPPTAGSLAGGNSTVPDEYLVDPAIDTLLLIMKSQGIYIYKTAAHPTGIVRSNDIVIIKGSFQWDFRNTTSTDRIKGLIWQILQHPDGFTGEILVGDNTQWAPIDQNDNNSEDTNQSILDVINTFHSKGYPVYLFEWKDIMYNVVTEYSQGNYIDGYPYDPVSKISYPKFKSPSGNHYISLKYGIWNANTQTYNHDRLCIVDFPVLKAHGWTGATLAIKNWIGVLTVAYQDERYGGDGPMHFEYMFGEYALPAKVIQVTFPKLTIIDAAWTNPERNYGSIAIQLNMLLGSTDPFAASWYAAKYMLTPVAYYPENTNPDNTGGTYYSCLNNWINCMHDSGFAVTKNSSEISVYDRAVLSATSTFNLTVSISDGWNMVSIPGLHPLNQNVTTWWSGKDPSVNVYKYNQGYLPITTAKPTEGYWMKHLGTNEYNTGDEWPAIQIVPHDPINATSGWNMFGGYENSILITDLTTTPSGLIEGPIYNYQNGFQVAEEITPGYGYWVRLSEEGLINIPESKASGNTSKLFKEYFPADWGKIIFTDAESVSFTLYSVDNEINLNNYYLPPLPPPGAIDIRFSTGRIVEKLRDNFKTILISGVEYPLTVRVENTVIRLLDETGNFVDAELKSGEELTINDNSVNKLLVQSGETIIPKEYSLEQNYPNPFNPSTKIKFAIPKESFVNLRIFNALGELVTTLVAEQMKPGYYKYEYVAANIPSGVYLYSLIAGDFIETKKMILIK